MPTITGRSKTGLFGAILTVAFTCVPDMGSSFVLDAMPRVARFDPPQGKCSPRGGRLQTGGLSCGTGIAARGERNFADATDPFSVPSRLGGRGGVEPSGCASAVNH